MNRCGYAVGFHLCGCCGVRQVFNRLAGPSNENKISDGGRERASLGVGVWKSSQKWNVQRSAVRSIAWLDGWRVRINRFLLTAVVNRRIRIKDVSDNWGTQQ